MNGFGVTPQLHLNLTQPQVTCMAAGGYYDPSTGQCLASKPSAIPTWGWIAAGAAVVGIGAWFLLK